MRQTLLSRWEGSLLGSSLGEVFPSREHPPSPPPWRRDQQQGVEALATTGKWNLSLELETLRCGELLLRCLPLLLFFHDDPQTLNEQLLRIAQQQQYSPEAQAAMLSYGTVIRWCLTEQLSEKTLFQDLQKTLQQRKINQTLRILQSNVEQGVSVKETKKQLFSTCQEIWLALYCFATTSEDLVLSVSRADKNEAAPSVTLALVGALSGAHNGVSSLSVPWRIQLHEPKKQWQEQLVNLLGTWSGSYGFAKIDFTVESDSLVCGSQISAIASPKIIQSR